MIALLLQDVAATSAPGSVPPACCDQITVDEELSCAVVLVLTESARLRGLARLLEFTT